MIITILGVLILAFILILPQVLDIQRREKTEQCIKNMTEIESAIRRYMSEREENFIGDTTDLHRTGYLRRPLYVCPEGTPESQYYTEGNLETGEIIVTCPLVEEYPEHVLPSAAIDD
jgi:competence protein ComGC